MLEQLSAYADDVALRPGADDEVLRSCETRLGHPLPRHLRALLHESDGLEADHGLELVWPAHRLAAENVQLRTDPDLALLYMPFDAMLFFGAAGNGDLFAMVLRDERPDVFAWDHETDSRTWIAPGLERYLLGRLDGSLSR